VIESEVLPIPAQPYSDPLAIFEPLTISFPLCVCGWRAFLTGDETELDYVDVFCPECARDEFGSA
jgi:hypothetical protein